MIVITMRNALEIMDIKSIEVFYIVSDSDINTRQPLCLREMTAEQKKRLHTLKVHNISPLFYNDDDGGDYRGMQFSVIDDVDVRTFANNP